MQLVFVDQDGAFTTELAKLLPASPNVSYVTGDVQDVHHDKTAFVSWLNSYLFMDGGIDRVYSQKMFPGVEDSFREAVRRVGRTSKVGRTFLPIGSAVMSQVLPTTYLIGAPTMLMPQNVSDTRNAYWATLAVLYLAERAGSTETIVFPPPACGWGKMLPRDSAHQVWWALLDHPAGILKGTVQGTGAKTVCYLGPVYPLPEQPNYYENSEFKNISAHNITRSR